MTLVSKCARRARHIHSLSLRTARCTRYFSSSTHADQQYPSLGSLASSLHGGVTDLQLEFQTLALNFCDTELKPFAREWDERKCVSYDTIRKAADLGFGGLYVSEENGGLGLSRLDSSLIFEMLSMGCVSTTALLTIHNMTAWMLDTFHGDQEFKREYLARLLSCQWMGSYCLTEAHCGSDAAALKTSARKDGDHHYVISGSKVFISGGGKHDVYFVMCRTGTSEEKGAHGISCFMIPYGEHAASISFGENERKMGWNGSPTSTVFFDDVRVHKSFLVGEENQGFKYAMRALDGGRLNIAACSLGAAHRCLQDAITYALSPRETFGKANLAQFQNVQFEIADLAANLHCSRLMLRDAASKLDDGHAMKSMYCAMAKKKVTDLGFEICNRSLQIFGGYGYLCDYEVERFVRDCRVHQILEGTNEIMNVVVSRALLDPKLNNIE